MALEDGLLQLGFVWDFCDLILTGIPDLVVDFAIFIQGLRDHIHPDLTAAIQDGNGDY
jgi:hypothetical protein